MFYTYNGYALLEDDP